VKESCSEGACLVVVLLATVLELDFLQHAANDTTNESGLKEAKSCDMQAQHE